MPGLKANCILKKKKKKKAQVFFPQIYFIFIPKISLNAWTRGAGINCEADRKTNMKDKMKEKDSEKMRKTPCEIRNCWESKSKDGTKADVTPFNRIKSHRRPRSTVTFPNIHLVCF